MSNINWPAIAGLAVSIAIGILMALLFAGCSCKYAQKGDAKAMDCRLLYWTKFQVGKMDIVQGKYEVENLESKADAEAIASAVKAALTIRGF